MNQQQQPVDNNFDFSKTEPIETWSGDMVWQSGFILRKVPKSITGTNEEAVIPVQVFFDPKTGKILDNTLPESLRNVINGGGSSAPKINWGDTSTPPNTENQPQTFQWDNSQDTQSNDEQLSNTFSWK